MTSFARNTAGATALLLAVTVAHRAEAQGRRLELSDTTRRSPASAPTAQQASPQATPQAMPQATPPNTERNVGFVRDQTILGATIYAPSFATIMGSDALGWTAGYLVMAGGSFFGAAELSRDITITEPMRRLANGAAIHGAAAGLLLGRATNLERRSTAGAVFLGSLAGTAVALTAGRHVSDDEVAGAMFGADAGMIESFALATATMKSGTSGNSADRSKAGIAMGGMVLGAVLGAGYAGGMPYKVTAGDMQTLWAAGAVGAVLGSATYAGGTVSESRQATALGLGSALGLFVGDRFLVRRYDHSRTDATYVQLGAIAGGLMGAGVSVLAGASKNGYTASTAILTAAGGLGGIILGQRFSTPTADAGRALGGLQLDPAGILAVAGRRPGSHSLLRWTF